jgi:hypothetical protein
MTCPVSSLRLSVHAVATLGMTGQERRSWRPIRARLTLIRASARGVSSRSRGAGEGSPPHRRSSPRLWLGRRVLRRAAGRLGRTRSRRCSERSPVSEPAHRPAGRWKREAPRRAGPAKAQNSDSALLLLPMRQGAFRRYIARVAPRRSRHLPNGMARSR